MLGALYKNWINPSPEWTMIKVEKGGIERSYALEKLTGDLYLPASPKNTSDYSCGISIRAIEIFFLTPFYALGVMAYNVASLGLSIHDPRACAEKIKRTVLAPFYALAMMATSLYTIVFPLYGRVWLGFIQEKWLENTPLKQHLFYYSGLSEPQKMAQNFAEGRIIFLAPCMIKRGNIEDKKGNEKRFKLIGG